MAQSPVGAARSSSPSNASSHTIITSLGIVGASAGVLIAGRNAAPRASIAGSVIGAAAGTAVGLGLHHLITEEMSQDIGKAGALALFTISQGTLAAAGGRVGAVIRSRH